MIKVIEWDQEGGVEGPVVYRLDDVTEGSRFFQHLLDNAEVDGRERFKVREVTEAEWAEIEKRGEESA